MANPKIRALLDTLALELEAMVHEAAAEMLRSNGSLPTATTTQTRTLDPGTAKRPAKAAPVKGGKAPLRRSEADFAKLEEKVFEAIKKTEGTAKAEGIKKVLKLDNYGWERTIKALLSKGRVSRKGKQRDTTYSVKERTRTGNTTPPPVDK